MSDTQLRIGDAERENAAAELGEHYAQGRLSTEEHSERLERIWATRTQADLGPIFRDLPGAYGPADTRADAAQVERSGWSARRRFPSPVMFVLAVIGAITVAIHLPVVVAVLLVLLLLSRRRRRYAGARC